MTPPLPQKKARAYSLAFMLLILAIITYWNVWWPGVLLAIGLPSALKQGLMKKYADMSVSLIVFVGSFIAVQFGMGGKIIAAILLFSGSLYVFIKELMAEKKKEL